MSGSPHGPLKHRGVQRWTQAGEGVRGSLCVYGGMVPHLTTVTISKNRSFENPEKTLSHI